MSSLAGHQFIRAVRADPALRTKIAVLGTDPRLEDIVRLAADAGHAVEAETLRLAYGQDWALRWLASKDTGAGNRDSRAHAKAE
jgi:hypothetical protein